jgi:hypothetical protein
MYRKSILLISLLCLAQGTFAQSAYSVVHYGVAVPAGETRAHIEQTGWRGIGLEFGRFITPKVSVGLAATWNVMYQNMGRRTVQVENDLTLTGNQYRYFNALPVLVTGRYFFRGQLPPNILPFVGLGAGAIHARRETQMGLYTISNAGWQVGIFPEAGLGYVLPAGVAFFVSARYNQGFSTSALPATSYVGVNIGLAYIY